MYLGKIQLLRYWKPVYLLTNDEIPLRAAISITLYLVIQATKNDMEIVGRNVAISAGLCAFSYSNMQ